MRYRVEREEMKFISISEYVIFCLTNEIPNQLAFKGAIYYVTIMTVISSHVKITCYLQVFVGKLTWYFSGVYIIKCNKINYFMVLATSNANSGE